MNKFSTNLTWRFRILYVVSIANAALQVKIYMCILNLTFVNFS